MYGGGVPCRRVLETRQGEAIVVRMKEDGLTIMPAVDAMLRNAQEGVAGWPEHGKPHTSDAVVADKVLAVQCTVVGVNTSLIPIFPAVIVKFANTP